MSTQGTQNDDKKKKKNNTICVGHHYTQANTYNVNKTWTLLQTTWGKDEPEFRCPGRVDSSCFTGGTRHVILVKIYQMTQDLFQFNILTENEMFR
jgi:hypothetical protein